jgi:hypothetical protein
MSFAMSATLAKLTAHDLTSVGVSGTAADWPGYLLACTTAGGMLIEQAAFSSGRLAEAATVLVIANPVLGSVIGVIGFGEPLPGRPIRLAGLALGAVVVIVGVAVLSHSPLLQAAVRGRTPARPDPGCASGSPGPRPKPGRGSRWGPAIPLNGDERHAANAGEPADDSSRRPRGDAADTA